MNPEIRINIFCVLATAIILVTGASFATIMRKPQTTKPVEKPSFEKVAEYENCDIIRWTDPSNRYQHFMKCPR